MKQAELNFKCQRCEVDIGYGWKHCPNCGGGLLWNNIRLVHEDKYIDIYEVHV